MLQRDVTVDTEAGDKLIGLAQSGDSPEVVGALLSKVQKYRSDGLDYCDIKTREIYEHDSLVGKAVVIKVSRPFFLKRRRTTDGDFIVAFFYILPNGSAHLVSILSREISFLTLRSAWRKVLSHALRSPSPLAA